MKRFFLFCILIMNIFHLTAQQPSFFNHFKKIELPFISKDDTFDFYNADEPYIFGENELIEFLMVKSDSFLIEKNKLNILFNNNYDYFTVGQFMIDNGVNCALYYRNYIEKGPEYTIELILVTLNSDKTVINSIPVSVLYTKKDIFSDSIIEQNGNIRINYFFSSTQKMIKTENYKIDKDGIVKLIF